MTDSPMLDLALEKVCTKCGETKALGEFYKKKAARDGRDAMCKVCVLERNRAWRAANLERDKQIKRLHAAEHSAEIVERVRKWRKLPGNRARKNEGERNRRKTPEWLETNAAYGREYKNRPGVREALNERRRKARAAETPEERESRLALRRQVDNSPEKKEAARLRRAVRNSRRDVKDKANAARRRRYAESPLARCAAKMRTMLARVLRKVGGEKTAGTVEMLGYSPEQFRQRIEYQFTPGMSWSNRGYRSWHIDHRKPIAAFVMMGVTDPRIINALCNLKPMWAEENQEKSYQWPYTPPANDNNKIEVRDVA